jgi:nicotinamide mononucleotide transporter
MLDFFGTFFSMLSTYYFIRVDYKAWYVSLIACVMNGYLYFETGIYADAALELIYFLMTAMGLYRWLRVKSTPTMDVSTLTAVQWPMLFIWVGCLYAAVYYLLIQFTQSTIPFLDAFTATVSLTAQLLMCYKIIVTWLLWSLCDAFYIVLYAKKSLPFHSGLMCFYTFLALYGYYKWQAFLPIKEEKDLVIQATP